jgi:Rhs element Vgr protein
MQTKKKDFPMSDATIIPTDQPTDLATFTIKINGETIPRTTQILMVVVNKQVNRIPFAKLTVADGDPSTATFEQSEGDLFRPGSEIEIAAGYHSDEHIVFKGLLTSQKLKVRRTGSACLLLEARDPAYKLTAIPKFRLFSEMPDSDIVDEILVNHNLIGELEATETEHEQMVQNNVTDWDFILSRLEANAQLITLDNGTLTSFKPDPSAESVLSIAYGSTIMEADLEIDSRIQLSGLKARSWVYTDQEILEAESSYSDEPESGSITVDDLASLNDPESFYLNDAGMATDAELNAWADAHKMKMNFAKIRGTIVFQGFPQLTAGDNVEIGGFGEVFNGIAFVAGVRHQIIEGSLTTTCQIGIDPEFFLKCQKVESDSKLVPPIKGLHSGRVLQLEDDPKGENRVLVNIPMLTPDGQGIWARVSTLDAGDSRGSFFLPELDDEVLVGFFDNDPRYPVILGMMNSSAKPAPLTAADDNHEKGFITRSEMKIVFNDDTKTIEISTPGGNIMKLDEDEGMIHLEDQNGNKMTLNADGITIESAADINIKASGDINLDGTNISNSASAEFKADGGAGAELTTGAICKVEGSLVQIN